ncbi:MAG: hypothetical protein A2355_15980 [Spirochaetes bacterium RIFOXYB1_FULL_32_8]|nr:MAG: hypothetical protein A2355_15980 [Spirochaetes bacterium RIFOXYB1_FULL_32_8]
MEVRPILHEQKTPFLSYNFIIDRTGPSFSINSDIPNYTSNTKFDLSYFSKDHYTLTNDIKIVVISNGESREVKLIDGKISFLLNYGINDLTIFALDTLGNVSEKVERKIIVDNVAPHLSSELSYVKSKLNNTISAEIKYDCFDEFTDYDNLKVYYKVNDTDWILAANKKAILEYALYPEGELILQSYCEDLGGNKSVVISNKIIIDKTPLPKFGKVKLKKVGNDLQFSFDYGQYPDFKTFHVRKETFGNKEPGRSHLMSDFTEKEFVDSELLNDISFDYYFSVVDIYGNVSEEYVINSMNYVSTGVMTGVKLSLNIVNTTLSFTKDESIPEYIGGRFIELDNLWERDKVKYKFLDNSFYEFGPNNSMFNNYIIWEVPLSNYVISNTVDKKKLAVFYHNESLQKWEYVPTKYDAATNKLYAKIKHFSVFAIGEYTEGGTFLTENNVSNIDGSLNRTINLLELPTHQSSFKLNAVFNSNSVNQLSKFLMDENTSANNRIFYVYHLDTETSRDDRIINYENYAEVLKGRVEDKLKLTEWISKIDITEFPNCFSEPDYISASFVLDYKNCPQEVSSLYGAWDLNIPTLIAERNSSGKIIDNKSFKYVKLEDGVTYELYPDYDTGIHYNRVGKRFIYKKVDIKGQSFYVVKTEMYKNYVFNTKGQLRYIFTTNNLHADMENKLNGDKSKNLELEYIQSEVIEENGKNVKKNEIISYNKNSETQSKVILNYSIIGDKDIYFQELSSIEFQEKNVSDELGKIKTINFTYTDQITEPNINAYIYAHNHNITKSNDSIKIKFRSLKTIEETKSNNVNLRKINVDTQYKYVTMKEDTSKNRHFIEYSSALGIKGFPERKIIGNIKIYTNDSTIKTSDGKYYDKCVTNTSSKDSFPLTLQMDNFYSIQNDTKISTLLDLKGLPDDFIKNSNKIVQLSSFSISDSKDHTKTDYSFETLYPNDFKYLELLNERYLTVTKSTQNNNLEVHYEYTTTKDASNPFSKTKKTFNDKKYSFGSVSNGDEVSEEYTIGIQNVVIKKLESNSNKETFYDYDSAYRLHGVRVFYKDKLFNNSIYEYEYENSIISDRLVREVTYKSQNTWNEKIYKYKSLDNYCATDITLKKEEEFLYPQIDRVYEKIDGNTYKVHDNIYQKGVGNNRVNISKTKDYLGTKDTNDAISITSYGNDISYHYDPFNRVDKETHYNSSGVELYSVEYQYDTLNNIISTKKTGKSNTLKIDNTIINESRDVTTYKVYDLHNKEIAEYSNKEITLKFYDDYGRIIKKLTTDYKIDGEICSFVNTTYPVVYFFYDKYIEGDSYISMKMTRNENISLYLEYIKKIVKKNVDSTCYDFSEAQFTNYTTMLPATLDLLKKDGIYSELILQYRKDNIVVRESESKRDSKNSTHEKNVYYVKSYSGKEYFKIESLESGKYLFTARTYDIYNNISSNAIYTKGSLETASSPVSTDYYDGKIEYVYSYDTPYTIYRTTKKSNVQILFEALDNNNNVLLKKIYGDNGSVSKTDYTYNSLNKITKSVRDDGYEETFTYNIWGLESKDINNSPYASSGKIPQEKHLFDAYGNEISKFNTIMSMKQNKPNESYQYDSFGNLVLITYSKDTDIIYSGNTTTPNITDTLVYDTSNNLLLKRSNLHTDTPLLNDEKYEYNNRNLLKKKTSYGYDLSSSNTIEFTEEYSYNDNDQLIDKIISKKINTTPEVIDETYITEIDQNGKQCKIYSRKKGEKWNITTQSYSTDGKLKFSITKIVDSDSKLTRTNLNTLDILGELYKSEYYALYDDFNRLVAEVNSDGTRKYYKYNNKNQIEKMYENENFPSTIVDNKIIIGDLTSKRGMQFEYYPVSGSKYKEYTKNSSSVNIYYKEFQYDKYGRILSESMDRVYSGNSYKKINYKYDLLNRLSSINKDDVTETTTQFEYEGTDKTRKVTTSINKGDSKDTFSEIVYSDYGNVVSSKDRDGYIHIDKYDIAGNLVETVKKLGTVEVQRTSATYKKYLYMTTKSSGITNIAKKYYIDTYSYDTNGNISGIESKDLNGVILSSKSFTYYDNNLLKKQIINIGTGASVVTHTIQYEYKASGQLNKLIYPDGSQYTVDYTTTGELTATNPLLYKKDSSASVGNTIIKNISYITDTQKLNSIEYGDASLIAKVFEYDELGRLKSLDFNKNKTTSLLKQVYSYDTVGNISAIAETRKTDFIKKTYQRTFTYDSYNRLSSAYLTGGFSDMMNMKMHYIQYDHDDANNKVDFYDVQDDSNLKVDIKTKAPSILLKNRLAYNKSPAMIKIFKAPDTILAINMLKIMYFDKAGNKFLVDNDYTIEDKVSYVLITNTNLSNSNFEKIVKLTFMYDPTDKNDNSIENTANYQKISEFIKVYGDVNSITLNYDYDEMDNRVNQEKVTRMESGELVSNSSVLYSYDATKSKLSSDSNYKYEYNANGAMIKRTSTSGKNEWVYTWNRKNQLQSVVNTEKPSNIIISTINYTYDENGILLKKSSGTTTTTYIYNGVELLYEKTANTADTTKNIEKKYIYLSGSLISVIETANSDKEHEKVYYYYNVCGESTRFITNSFGENVYEGVTGPFGEEITQSAADMRGKWATHDGIEPETGLTYMINRWMDNETGRFISPDVMKQNLNYYTYANNNPYTRIDPDGNVDSLYSSWNSGFNYGFSSSKYTSSYSDGFDFSMSDGYNNNEGYDLNIISGNKFTFDFTESSMQKTNKIWSFGSNTDVFSNDTYTVDYEKHPIKSVIKDIGYNTVGAVKSFYNALSFGVLPPVKEALSFSLFTANKLSDAMNAFDDFLYDKFEMDTFDMTGALLPILPFSEGAWSGFRTMLSYGKKASAFGSFGLNGGKASIGSTGKYGENMLKQLGGESQQYFKTTGIPRGRFVDQLVDGIANESKVGYTSLTKSIQTQILKDVELISKGKIDGAVWHFYKSPITGQVGASQPLLNELSKYGIPYIIH